MPKLEQATAAWPVWWFRTTFAPIVIPAGRLRRAVLALKIVAVVVGLLVVPLSLRLTPIHLVQALAGAAVGFAYFHVAARLLWRRGHAPRMRPWRTLGEGAEREVPAAAAAAVTFLTYAAFEEVLWRYLIQQHVLAGTSLAVPVTAVAFCAEHFLWQRPARVAPALELLGLAILLGLSVPLAGSIVPAVFMHWTRNLCVLRCSDDA